MSTSKPGAIHFTGVAKIDIERRSASYFTFDNCGVGGELMFAGGTLMSSDKACLHVLAQALRTLVKVTGASGCEGNLL